MPHCKRSYPIYPLLFAVFPVLSLLGNNIREIDPGVAIRSLLLSVGGSLLIMGIARLLMGDWHRAALTTTLLLALFFSYGQLHSLLKDLGGIGVQLARHRYLAPAFALAGAGGTLLIWKNKLTPRITPALNSILLLMLLYPSYQTISFLISTELASNKEAANLAAAENIVIQRPEQAPDVYYIILDMHGRSDALLQDYELDISDFITEMQSLGFVIAECSRSNYVSTSGSLTSALNMQYIADLQEQLAAEGLAKQDVTLRMRHSQVRAQLEGIGYQTIAFDSGYEWSRLSDADIYLSHTRDPYAMQRLQPFEAMLIKSTAFLLWADTTYAAMPDYVETPFHGVNFALEDHVNRQLFTLDQLPRLASLSGPKFVFAHLIVPHIPFVFEADGSIVTDPGYYSGELLEPVDREHLVRGYANQVQFIDDRIVEVARQILENSSVPPIIVIQGDHGLEHENRLAILNAYYLPGDGNQSLYPSITPVNSFRVIFNTYFSGNYPLLPDQSYGYTGEITPETYPTCITP